MFPGFNDCQCKDCDAWMQEYPENKQLGNCTRLPIIIPCDGVIGLIRPNDWRDNPDVTRDIKIVRTTADFGCVGFTPKRK
jgi:hypothetical protein